MSKKLKFKDEENRDAVTELTEETAEKPKVKRKNPVIADDPPPDGKTPPDAPAADQDGGGDIPDADASDPAEPEITVTDTPDPVISKLYERESSLKFTRETEKPIKPDTPVEKPVKKRQKVYGVEGDHSTHDNLINKPVIPVGITAKINDGDEAADVDNEDVADHDGDEETPDADITADTDPKGTEPKKPTTAKTPKPPRLAVPLVAVPVVAPVAKKLAKPKKPEKTASKLKFSKDEKPKTKEGKAKAKEAMRAAKQDDKIGELQYKTDLNAYKLEKARAKQPTKKKKVKERVFDEKTGKAKTKLRFEETPLPINEAKWNLPKKQSLPVKGAATATAAGINKLHSKIYEVERDNVGTQAAHRAELVGESAYRGGKKLIHTTYRHVKNSPYRKAAKLEVKEIKSRIKLDYAKAVKENPKLKSNVLSRYMQKRKIKRQYAAALRDAKKTGNKVKEAGKVTAKVTEKAMKLVSAIVRKNPVFLLKVGLILLILILIMALLSMCVSMLGSGTGFIGAASYAAEDEDINQAALAYSEWETDLRMEIINAETTYSGYDEYRYNIDYIGHDPLALMAFLTAVYQDFTYAEIESVLQGIFAEQYTLEFVPSMEIRTRWETHTGYDADGEPYDYDVEVEYEWHILTINLTSVPFGSVLDALMDDDQKEHFNILMLTKGARQYGATPFDFDWLPYVTSHYGYRVHPISGTKELHRGIDIGLPEGTEILAGIVGVVTTASFDSGFGNYVVIESEDGIVMKYAHCHTLLVSVGQTVEIGDVIATVGTTGSSTGNHLHMEILKDGVYLNPIYYVMTFPY